MKGKYNVSMDDLLVRLENHQNGFSSLSLIALILFVATVLISAGLGVFYYIRSTTLTNEALLYQNHRAEELVAELEANFIGAKQLAASTIELITPLHNDKQTAEALLLHLCNSASPESVYGIGAWFEPRQFIPEQTYFGPYARRKPQGGELTYEWSTPEADYLARTWYKIGLGAKDDVIFTEPYLELTITHKVFMSLVKAILNDEQEVIGVVTVDMVLSLIRQLILKATTSQELSYIFTQNNRLLAHPQENEILTYFSQNERNADSILNITPDDLAEFNAIHYTPESFHTTTKPVKYVNWTLHVMTEKKDLFKKVYELRKDVIYVAVFLWAALIVFLLLLANLSVHARRAREEQKRLQTEVRERQRTEAFLHQMNDELEQRVQERTSALGKASEEIKNLNQLLAAENQRMGAELNVTRQLQEMVLPREQELAAIQQLDIACLMVSATEVGGDYYDVLRHGNRIKIGIGDVTGHGLASGVLMMMVQTAVRTLLTNDVKDANQFMNVLNRTIYDNVQRMEVDKNLTLALLDYQNGTIRITGQHEDILVFRARGEEEHIDTFPLGFMVGVEPDISNFVNSIDVTLQQGDGIVLYTDGITEARNTHGQLYGLERLCQVIRKHWHLSAHEIKQIVFDDVHAYIQGGEQLDDITLLILKQK